MTTRWLLPAVAAAGLVLACDFQVVQQGATLELDVDAELAKVEQDVVSRRHQDEQHELNYALLDALCRTEPGANCTAPHFPTYIPRALWPFGCILRDGPGGAPRLVPAAQCTMALACEPTDPSTLAKGLNLASPPQGNGCMDVASWMQQEGAPKAGLSRALALDLRERPELQVGAHTTEIDVQEVAFLVRYNTLSYPLPQTHCWVGGPVDVVTRRNAAALVEKGAVQEFGTLPELPLEFTGRVDVALQEGGAEVLAQHLQALQATLVAQGTAEFPPPETQARAANCLDPNHPPGDLPTSCACFRKPSGRLSGKVEVTLAARPALSR